MNHPGRKDWSTAIGWFVVFWLVLGCVVWLVLR